MSSLERLWENHANGLRMKWGNDTCYGILRGERIFDYE